MRTASLSHLTGSENSLFGLILEFKRHFREKLFLDNLPRVCRRLNHKGQGVQTEGDEEDQQNVKHAADNVLHQGNIARYNSGGFQVA